MRSELPLSYYAKDCMISDFYECRISKYLNRDFHQYPCHSQSYNMHKIKNKHQQKTNTKRKYDIKMQTNLNTHTQSDKQASKPDKTLKQTQNEKQLYIIAIIKKH